MSIELPESAKLTARDWFRQVEASLNGVSLQAASEDIMATVSQNKVHFDAAVKQNVTIDYHYAAPGEKRIGKLEVEWGGFFTPITHSNHEEAIRRIFEQVPGDDGQWLVNYHKAIYDPLRQQAITEEGYETVSGKIRDNLRLTDEQRAFIEMMDRLQLVFLDPRPSTFDSQKSAKYTADGTLTSAELAKYLAINKPDPNKPATFRDHLEGMGDYGMSFIQYFGGVQQGRIAMDLAYETVSPSGIISKTYTRHLTEDIKTMSAVAQARLNGIAVEEGLSFDTLLSKADGECNNFLVEGTGRVMYPSVTNRKVTYER